MANSHNLRLLATWLGYLASSVYAVPRLVEVVNGRAGPILLLLPLSMVAVTWALSRYPLPAIVVGAIIAPRHVWRALVLWFTPVASRVGQPRYSLVLVLATIGTLLWIATLTVALLALERRSDTIPRS